MNMHNLHEHSTCSNILTKKNKKNLKLGILLAFKLYLKQYAKLAFELHVNSFQQ